jgi:hypothetical protein
VSLVARHLEANGIPTVVLGCARDIVEHVGVPRFVFSDFPLGNSCGKPFDDETQQGILEHALGLLESATAPRTTVQTPYVWSEDASWRDQFLDVGALADGEPAERIG